MGILDLFKASKQDLRSELWSTYINTNESLLKTLSSHSAYTIYDVRLHFNVSVINFSLLLWSANLALSRDLDYKKDVINHLYDKFFQAAKSQNTRLKVGEVVKVKEELDRIQNETSCSKESYTDLFTLYDLVYQDRQNKYIEGFNHWLTQFVEDSAQAVNVGMVTPGIEFSYFLEGEVDKSVSFIMSVALASSLMKYFDICKKY